MLIMRAVIDGQINGMNFKDFEKTNQYLSFGSYCFKCQINGEYQSIPFDWDGFTGNIQKDGTLCLLAGNKTPFGETGILDDIYDEEYSDMGFTRKDITAELLSKTIEIEEFNIDYDADDNSANDYISLKEIVFNDGENEYSVSKNVLEQFNNLQKQRIENLETLELD